MENNNQKNEQLLLDMAREMESKNKTIWTSMWVIMGFSMAALLAGIFIAAFLIPEGIWQLVAIVSICIFFLIPCFYALKLEISAGAYKCKNCGHEIVPTYAEAVNSLHRGFTRRLMCPSCGKRTWCKKILTGEKDLVCFSLIGFSNACTGTVFLAQDQLCCGILGPELKDSLD